MHAENPYQSPTTASDVGQPAAALTAFRDGAYLVVRFPGTILPRGCAICSAPEAARKTFQVRQVPVWLLGAIAFFMPTARINLGLCAQHARRESRARLIPLLLLCGGLFVGAIPGIVGIKANSLGDILFATVGFAGIAAALVYWLARGRPLRPYRANRHFIWIAGLDPGHLAQLPAAQPPPGDPR